MNKPKTDGIWVENLAKKYKESNQDLEVHLEGLYHSKNITYWDYIQLETLLTLQQPRTEFTDEPVFILYHQITELYFKLALSEYKLLAESPKIDAPAFVKRINRINRYFDCLTQSFTVMMDGMDVGQYLQFRTALTPASGFQSAQYRLIELSSTDIKNLVDPRYRESIPKDATIEQMMDKIYWKAAGIDPTSGKKSLTLISFEKKYLQSLIQHANQYKDANLWSKYTSLPENSRNNADVLEAMKTLDYNINRKWPLAHYRAALRYLEGETKDVAATGGSAWKKYLHPKYQKRMFFPELWHNNEMEDRTEQE